MPTRARPPEETGRAGRVLLRAPRRADATAFLAAVAGSRRLHRSWVAPPSTAALFAAYVRLYGKTTAEARSAARRAGFLVVERESGALAGVFNLSEIVHGSLQSAFLGYYGFAGHTGRGLMREGLALTLAQAFGPLGLHRVEANVQPGNARSIALVEAAGFTLEGFSRRYLKVAGRWRDHARYALLAEDWRRMPGKRR